jgi:vacuolar-type H+-ATPase subunit H
MTLRWMDRMPEGSRDPLPYAQKVFETIGFAKVSTSGPEAKSIGYLRDVGLVTMNRDRLIADAKGEAADILADARKVADAQIERVKHEAEDERARRLEETKRQIEAETTRSLDMIRSEVADLTLEATARVTGKVLDAEDQRRLIDEAISELDFSALEKDAS